MRPEPQLSTAYHEAGHAVIAWQYGLYLRRATIEPNEDYQGVVVGNLVAGEAAQRRFNSRSVRKHHGHSDRQNVIDLLSYLCEPSSEVITHYYAMLEARARATVENPMNWRAIEVLAKELMRKRTIKGKGLREYIRSVCFAPGAVRHP